MLNCYYQCNKIAGETPKLCPINIINGQIWEKVVAPSTNGTEKYEMTRESWMNPFAKIYQMWLASPLKLSPQVCK